MQLLAYRVSDSLLCISTNTVTASLRVVLVEITRIENHLLNIACHAGDLGCLVALLITFYSRDGIVHGNPYSLLAS